MNTVVFDLDGVLLDFCEVHYNTLNLAIASVVGEEHIISRKAHETTYNGRTTRDKLALLGFDKDTTEAIYAKKQELTAERIAQDVHPSPKVREILTTLKSKGYKVACASNSIRSTIVAALTAMNVIDLFDVVLSNQEISKPKPDPEIYISTISKLETTPSKTIVFEDSWIGISAAIKSGACCQRVKNPDELTLDLVLSSIEYCNRGGNPLTRDMTVVIPMAGNGSRFAKAGYKDPKPLIPVFGKPMIRWVVDNIGIDAQYVFIIRKDFENDAEFLKTIVPRCKIIVLDKVTDGAARTVLLSEELINNQNPIIIANSDQYIEFSSIDFVTSFLYDPSQTGFCAKISTFDGLRNPKWSYAATDENGHVTVVKEKDPISDHATTGVYMWRHGSDFVRFAKQMIAKDIRVNNEYYVAPVFNEALEAGLSICISDCEKMWGLGTPEDLDVFIQSYQPKTL